ncbi:mono/diheme cytochrome c family protein [Constrictibacter sp. MBR-5]|uniref:c-type cytochrome n=1 Tax=Constrictibacter sp. MBR-5 TaxID=3156467 RepID=UPI003397E5D8
MRATGFRDLIAAAAVAALAATSPPAAAAESADGAALFDAAGCANCHTDTKGGGKPLAGGVALDTPFGTFRTPNITPDREHGIGAWSDADFIRAMREGVAPDGSHYYPAFPYTSYTRMTDADMLAIKRHIFAMEPAATPSKPHNLGFPFNQRWLMWGWNLLHFEPGPYIPDPDRSEAWNRGAYLVTAVAHCGECHTPRGALGNLDMSRWLGGNVDGPDGERVPNITPDRETGIGTWSASDIAFLLDAGMMPDGDVVGGSMYPVIEDGTDSLTGPDRDAIAEYLLSLPPVSNPNARATKAE